MKRYDVNEFGDVVETKGGYYCAYKDAERVEKAAEGLAEICDKIDRTAVAIIRGDGFMETENRRIKGHEITRSAMLGLREALRTFDEARKEGEG